MKSFKKPLLLSIKQIDSTDLRFNIFESDLTGYHFADSVILQNTGRVYRILYGFEILTANLEPDYRFPALCLSEKLPLVEILEIIVTVQRRKRELFPIETARIIHLACQSGMSDDDIVDQVFSLLHLKPDPALIADYRQMITLSKSMVRYLTDKHAPVKTWLNLVHRGLIGIPALDKFIQLNPTLSIFEEITTSLFEISKRESIRLDSLFESLHWNGIVEKADLEEKVRIRRIRDIILQRRFPKLSAHREQVEKVLKQIPLPENAKLNFDETFEKKEIQINWRLHTPADIERMHAFFNDETVRRLKILLNTL